MSSLDFDDSIKMLKLFYDMEVEQVSYSYTPLYGWCVLLEGFNAHLYTKEAERHGLCMVQDYSLDSINPGMIMPASLWKRDDGKWMTDNLFGLSSAEVDAEPLKLRADGRTWAALEDALSAQMVKDFDTALSKGL